MHDPGACLVISSSPEAVLLILPMNKQLRNAICLTLVSASGLSLARAQDGSPVTGSGAPATLMAVTVAPTVGAVVVEASTNLVDWTDVTTLLPNDPNGVFVDTQSTNFPYRFYRVRSVVSAVNNLVTVNGVTDLRAMSAVSSNADVSVRGYYAAGDGGGGRFYWDPNSTDSDDGGITIVPTSNPATGRWKRVDQNEINVKWFGAVGDGVNDDSSKIQAALDFVDRQGGGKVFLPKGVYLIRNRPVLVGNNTTFEGAGFSSVLHSENSYTAVADKTGFYPNVVGGSNIVIQSIAIDCAKKGNNGIVLNSVTDSTVHNVRISDPRGYGIWLFRWGDGPNGEGIPPTRITVSNCHITGVVDTGIELYGAVGCTVVGNTVRGLIGVGYLVWAGSTDCTVSGNVAEGEVQTSFIGYQASSAIPEDTTPNKTSVRRISFVGNVARNVSTGARVRSIVPTNMPSDILIQGNTFMGCGYSDIGVEIEEATRVSVSANVIDGFQRGIVMNDVSAGFPYDAAKYAFINDNIFKGGDTSVLYGNVGGSLKGNTFFGQRLDAAQVYAWRNCVVKDNTFTNLGEDRDTVGVRVLSYNGLGAEGNTFSSNVCNDDRDIKWTAGAVVFSPDPHDHNIVSGNNAKGAKAGAKAFSDFSSGTNNIVASNIDG